MATDVPGILIVDDNEDNRYTLRLLLESDGHERVVDASGGKEAIALLEKEKFNLVLLDMMMPDLNGDEVLKIIKADPDTRDIPVVMISADTDTEKVSKCIELGADDYLPKPFNPVILRARIASALRRGSLRSLETEYLGKIEQAKKHSENLLRNILPPDIAARLRNGESNIADHFEDATVIFADIVGFGKITARMKAYEIVGCLNSAFQRIRPAGRRYRSRKNKNDRRQLHGGRRRADAAQRPCAPCGKARARHGRRNRSAALATARAHVDQGGPAFRPDHGRRHWHAQICI